MDSFLVYAGLAAAAIGFVSLIRPLRLLRIPTRRSALGVFLAGIGFAVLGALWPAPKVRVVGHHAALDEVLPEYHFHEVHSLRVHASPGRVFQAIRDVRPEEIRYLATLMAIRTLPQRILAGDRPPEVVPGYRLRALHRENQGTRRFVMGASAPGEVEVSGRTLAAEYERGASEEGSTAAGILEAYREALVRLGGGELARDGCCRAAYHLKRGGGETWLQVSVEPEGRSFRLDAVSTKSASAGRPTMLQVLRESGFLLLREVRDRELVLGLVERLTAPPRGGANRLPEPAEFSSFMEPGHVKIGCDFRVEDSGGGWTQVRTETRILGTDETARRQFGIYWRLIHPGSALIRRSWLEAIRKRAEAPIPPPEGGRG